MVGGTEPGGVGSGHLRAIWTSGFRSLVCFSSHKMRRVDKRTASHSWVPGPVAAPTCGDLSEMLLLRRHWRPAASDTRGGPGPLCRRSPQGFPVLLTCEIHWTGRSPQVSGLLPSLFPPSAPAEEKAMAPHSSTLAWKIPWTEDPWSPWGREESDRTEQLHFHFSLSCIGEGNGNPLQCSCLENPRDGGAW